MTAETTSMEFLDSKPLLDARDFDGLRARADREGYLFFKQLMPAEPLIELRRQILAVVGRYGWLKEGPNGEDNLIDKEAIDQVPIEEMRYGVGVSDRAYEDVNRIELFHRVPHHPNLVGLYRGLFEDEVLVHARHIARIVTPHREVVPTPPHQDFPLIQGSRNFWTCWIPLGDCPREMGGLTVLRHSQHGGYIPVKKVKGAGEIAAQLCPGEDTWVSGDFAAGDVLTFPCHTVHKALPSQHRELARLSLDLRFQPLSEEVESRSLQPHAYHLTWEDIYKEWEKDDLQYYWDKLPLKFSPWDDSYVQPKRRIC